ncbi:hypothetical protein [Proteus sp. G2615]|uniref:hypothetical protein n=1 Tax=Proteus sp. G2615 TaxID=2698845 RepID=UPI001929B637|nr:hypothetical protein [Proteus sp. G2615]
MSDPKIKNNNKKSGINAQRNTLFPFFKNEIYFALIIKKATSELVAKNTIYVRKIYGFEITGRKP